MQFCNGFDNHEDKTISQMLVPVICILVLGVTATLWIIRNGLTGKFGLCPFKGNRRLFLWFVPLILRSCTNLTNGLAISAPLGVALLIAANMAFGGYVEEIIFRGVLLRAMAKDNLRSAILVSAVTFGAGHIVNVFHTANIFGVLLQVGYAIVIGFLHTVIAYKGGSLWLCIASQIFANGTSVFVQEEGPFLPALLLLFSALPPPIW